VSETEEDGTLLERKLIAEYYHQFQASPAELKHRLVIILSISCVLCLLELFVKSSLVEGLLKFVETTNVSVFRSHIRLSHQFLVVSNCIC